MLNQQDINYAIEQISIYEQNNAGIGRWKNNNKQHLFLQWQEESGHRAEDKKGSIKKPFEKEQYILWKVNKFGWSRSKGTERWNEFLAEGHERDYKGDDGQVRLWLVETEYADQSKTKYLDQRSQSQSEVIKNPSQSDAYALAMHVHAQGAATNFQHGFFRGQAGLPHLAKDEDDELEESSEEGDRAEGDTSTKRDQKNGEPPLKKLKGNIVKLRTNFNDSMYDSVNKVQP